MKNSIRPNIIFNSIKISMAAIIAIILASVMKLEFSVAAGIVTILTIQPTKKETLHTALGRLYAFAVALVIAYVSFLVLGFSLQAFFLYLLIYIFICHIFKWHSAMAMNSVLISHFINMQKMDVSAIGNEIMIFLIGVGVGIFANLHLRKRVKHIEQRKDEADQQIIRILSRMSERILNRDISDYNGDCFQILRGQIREAKNVAEENFNNQFSSDDRYDMEYIAMRERQCQVLYEMYKCVRSMDTSPHTAQVISDFLKKMSDTFEKGNDGKQLMQQFAQMDAYMKSQPLPIERKEFEDRARLYILMRNMEEFIQIKMEFMIADAKRETV